MELHELNWMFDQMVPTPEQEAAELDRLLRTERECPPMKRLKKLTVLAVAAALMVTACAAAVVTGVDKRLADFLGGGKQTQELLAPCAVPVDVTVEDNGATLHVSQVLMDRYNIMILADFTAPEGIVLNMGKSCSYQGFGRQDEQPVWLDHAGKPLDAVQSNGVWVTLLDDGDPLDNHLTLLQGYSFSEGTQPEWGIGGVSLTNIDLVRYGQAPGEYITVYSGDWSCEVPFVWRDMGQTTWPNQVIGQLDGADITLTELYFSPMNMRICYEWDIPELTTKGHQPNLRWHRVLDEDRMTLTTRDGKVIPLLESSGMAGGITGYRKQEHIYQLGEVVALEDLEGGNLNIRIEGGSVDIPLENLSE